MKFYSFNPMVDQVGSVIHLLNPVNVTRISIAGIVDRVFKLKVSCDVCFNIKKKNQEFYLSYT